MSFITLPRKSICIHIIAHSHIVRYRHRRRHAGSMAAVWPNGELLLKETKQKGRALHVSRDVKAGNPLLCEPPIAAVTLRPKECCDPWQVASELCSVIIKQGRVGDTADLHPKQEATLDTSIFDDADEFSQCARRLCEEGIAPNEARRLLQVVALNAMELSTSDNRKWQALYRHGSMLNHSCTPNAIQQGFDASSNDSSSRGSTGFDTGPYLWRAARPASISQSLL
eukprot:395657-Pleurochrysis_carterae.AAC.2